MTDSRTSKSKPGALSPLKMVTIIAEDALEERLIAELKGLGVRGYTIAEARGEGLSGRRESDWEGKNFQLQTIVSDELARSIIDRLAEAYFERFTVIAYVSSVEVFRRSHFAG